MKFDSHSLWNNFRNSLIETVKETSISSFEKAWESCGNRTEFYLLELFPAVAKKLGLKFRKEKPFRVDGTFFKTAGQTTEVPLIYFESENIATRSHEEVYKLCCLNAPLKILLICTEWNNNDWKKELIERHWYYIIEDIKDEIGLSGYFAFIIADGAETLKFHSYVLGENGDEIEATELVEMVLH